MIYPVAVLRWAECTARFVFGAGVCAAISFWPAKVSASSVTLAWNPSASTNVASYNIYEGVTSGVYTSVFSVANSTNVTITSLMAGTTYYFAATSTDTSGNESPFSNEIAYSVPTNSSPASAASEPPTLDPINPLTTNENAGTQAVNLSGITPGAGGQTLTVTAVSSNPGLISNPAVTYTSPNATGTLSFAPASDNYGTAAITVTVNNGGASNNLVSQTFLVTVNPVNQPPTLNPLSAMRISENSLMQTVNLSGITSGATNEAQVLTVTAASSNPLLIPNPAVTYSSPNSTGALTFKPAANTYGTAAITVTVNDGGASNNVVTQSFVVTVNPLANSPTLNPLTNLTVVAGAKQNVNLTGISSGLSGRRATVTLKATSSNVSVISTPAVNYISPNSSGVLTFTPLAAGVSIISVTVNNGQSANNFATQSFGVTVLPAGSTAPLITGAATNQIAAAGQNVTFSVVAGGTTPLNYQWKCNSCVLPGATNAVLNLASVTTNAAGVYSVTVSNGLGATNTSAALTVYPTFAATLSRAASSSHGQFALTINGATGLTYVVQASSNLVNWASLQTNTAPFTFVDSNASQFSQRYYRTVYLKN